MRLKIGSKINALAVFLILMTLVVSLVSFSRIALVNKETKEIAQYYLPLIQIISNVDQIILGQELRFSQILENQKRPIEDLEFSDDKIKAFNLGTRIIDKKLIEALKIVNDGLHSSKLSIDTVEFKNIEKEIHAIEIDHREFCRLNLVVLEKLKNKEEAKTFVSDMQDNRRKINHSVSTLLNKLESFTLSSSQTSDQHEAHVLKVNSLVLGSTSLLGLILALFISKSLVRPIHQLVKGTRSIADGNLETEVTVSSKDEIGELAGSFNQMVSELRVKERIKKTFGKYIDPRIVEQLISESDGGKFQGEKRNMTVLFSDIKGFTHISENMTPDLLVKVINLYFTVMSQAVSKYEGVIDKYIGDAVMAFWGPPFTSEKDHPKLACFTALEKMAQLDVFREQVKQFFEPGQSIPEFDIRIGIATGDMIVGNVGSDLAQGYTVLGDTVNTGSRLEGVSKVYGTRILIHEQTQKVAGDFIETREIDSIQVVGKDEPVRIFELIGKKNEVDENILKLKFQFEKGLQAYRNKDWSHARQLFNECLQIKPDDSPSKVFLDRIAHFEKNSPEKSWDGTWRLTKK
jgi:class 3 adenylate cyclase/CHASE3 domain sensor protein